MAPSDSDGLRLAQIGLFAAEELPITLAWSGWLRGSGSPIGFNNPYAVWVLGDEWSRRSQVGVHERADLFVTFIRRERGGDAERRIDIWGAQAEVGWFPSSFIPRLNADGPGRRGSDVLRAPAASLSPAQGTFLVWHRPMFGAAAADGEHLYLQAGG